MKAPAFGSTANSSNGERKTINPELWHACAGPLVSLPVVGTYVVYFPQGHSEQVAASMQKDADAHIPNYPNLPSKLICLLHNVTLHADAETDEVYAQMTLQPVKTFDKEILLASELALKSNKPQMEFFCKTLTASDTSTHGGFSVPRRAAEKIFPPLDFTMQPPAQELTARDLHDNLWNFRHIYRGQPKRHLLTTGWSLFVSGKRLVAGDSVLFIRDEKSQLLLGIRRANRQPLNMSSSVLSSDSMHIGILAAAAHAATNLSPFTVFYNPRASPSEFVIPLAKYNKAVYGNQISLGMRFRMLFETEESGTRRYMGTITGISDLDPVRWKNSQWRNLQVGWDEAAAGERRNRVSIWEIEPVTTPFFICPPPFFRSKRPRQPGMSDDESSDIENMFKRAMPWLGEDFSTKDFQSQNAVLPGFSLVEWMNMQQKPSLGNLTMQPDYLRSLPGPVLQNLSSTDLTHQLGLQAQMMQQNNQLFQPSKAAQQVQQLDSSKLPVSMNRLQQQQLDEINQLQRHHLATQTLTHGQNPSHLIQPQILVQNQFQQPSQLLNQNHQPQPKLPQNQQQHQQQQEQQCVGLNQQPNQLQVQIPPPANQHLSLSEHQIQLQMFQKLQQQHQSILSQSQPMLQQPQLSQLQEQQRQFLEVQQHLPTSNLPCQQQTSAQQPQNLVKNTQENACFSQPTQQRSHQKLPELPINHSASSTSLISPPASSLLATGGSQSVITDDVPSCSTSPSTNNCPVLPQTLLNRNSHGAVTIDDIAQSTVPIMSSGALKVMTTGPSLAKDLQKTDVHVKPSIPVPNNHSQCTPQGYSNAPPPQMDYLDTPSTGTSVCLGQLDGTLQQGFPSSSLNPSAMLLRDTVQDDDIQADPRNNVLFGVNIDGPFGIPLTPEPLLGKNSGIEKDFQSHLSGNMLANYGSSKDITNDLSSSVVSQAFGVPEMDVNNGVSVNPTISNSGFLKGSTWAPPPAPQLQRMRTFTKVYKRGAVGRSVDIARYPGYDELKQDLARMFGIEGQLEDGQRIGWKLVYVDHEGDVLLVGDDPWEEFVNCVRSIKILSPKEVQKMHLDGDSGNSVLPNQACSSSDGGTGNAWKGGPNQGDYNSSS